MGRFAPLGKKILGGKELRLSKLFFCRGKVFVNSFVISLFNLPKD